MSDKQKATEEKLVEALSNVFAAQCSLRAIFDDVLSQTPPEGKTYLDLLTERLDQELEGT
jgi:hypothetical protein